MNYLVTNNGYNMFDMMSMMQKAIRRGIFEYAGFAANELQDKFRSAMWNRILVISSEDCYGVITKELVELRKRDEREKDSKLISAAIALLCKSLKSRDACYFACNFILASRNPRKIKVKEDEVSSLYKRLNANEKPVEFDLFGFAQGNDDYLDAEISEKFSRGVELQKAIKHIDMDMIGYTIDLLRRTDRAFLWNVMLDYAKEQASVIYEEIYSLKIADDYVNARKPNLQKDEIFISKAAILLCYCEDEEFFELASSDIVCLAKKIDWNNIRIKDVKTCVLENGEIPIWVFDCHTIKGKKMGKTDWDMTTDEQAALFPLRTAYFDEASWIYTYEQDFDNGDISEKGIQPIREYAKTHLANPVEFIPYE